MNKNIFSTIIDKVNEQRIKDEEDKIYAYTICRNTGSPIYADIVERNRAILPSITKASSLEDLYLQIFYSNINILLTGFLLDNLQNVNIKETLDLNEYHRIAIFYSDAESNVYENWKMKAKNNQNYINKIICLYIKSIEANSQIVEIPYGSYSMYRVYITKMYP